MPKHAVHSEDASLTLRLVEAIEAGDAVATADLIQALRAGRFDALFRAVGRITRELHDTLHGLAGDDRLVSLARQQMPDARDRLQYVIEKTEQAANRTLSAVETMIPCADTLVQQAAVLRPLLDQPLDDAAVSRLEQFLDGVEHDGRRLRAGLSDVLMAQEYQDLTGQVIKRTIELVGQVEEKLVELVTACGIVSGAAPSAASATSCGPAERADANAVTQQADVDELLANLGF